MKARLALRNRRGSSFVEILVALAILAVLMVGILQMFSLALLTNLGSAARTDLLYKAQQVVENLRLVYYLERKEGNSTARTAAGVPAILTTTTAPVFLPYSSGDASWAHWGPAGFNIVEAERLPYRIYYTVEAVGSAAFVTVTVTPVDNPNLVPPATGATLPAVTPADNPRRFLGLGSKVKIVTYTAQIVR